MRTTAIPPTKVVITHRDLTSSSSLRCTCFLSSTTASLLVRFLIDSRSPILHHFTGLFDLSFFLCLYCLDFFPVLMVYSLTIDAVMGSVSCDIFFGPSSTDLDKRRKHYRRAYCRSQHINLQDDVRSMTPSGSLPAYSCQLGYHR